MTASQANDNAQTAAGEWVLVPREPTTNCPKCSAPCITVVHPPSGDWGWGTSDAERTQYMHATSAPPPAAQSDGDAFSEALDDYGMAMASFALQGTDTNEARCHTTNATLRAMYGAAVRQQSGEIK